MAMPQEGRGLLKRFAVVTYWLLLFVFLLAFPILQSWEALPELGVWRLARYAILVCVALAAVMTRRRRLWHVVTVLAFLVAGVLLFALNQGILQEPPSAVDVRMLLRTKQLLVRAESWDRSASRDCSRSATRLTLYCAIREASIEETGNFRHRQPALQVVRSQIGVLKPNAQYEHRLSGFNSDPSVTLRDIQRLLDVSITKIQADLR